MGYLHASRTVVADAHNRSLRIDLLETPQNFAHRDEYSAREVTPFELPRLAHVN
jgi:hypothetical protein